MKNSLKWIIYGSSLTLLVGTAVAGTAGKEETTGSLAKMQPSAQFCDAESVIGKDVYNNQQQDLGDIKNVVFNARNGETFAAIGVGHDKYALVPWEALKMTSSKGKEEFSLNTTKQGLESGPTVQGNQWQELGNRSFTENIYKRYDVAIPAAMSGGGAAALAGHSNSSGKS